MVSHVPRGARSFIKKQRQKVIFLHVVLLTHHCLSSDKSSGDCCRWCRRSCLSSPRAPFHIVPRLHRHYTCAPVSRCSPNPLLQSQVHPLNHWGSGDSPLFPGWGIVQIGLFPRILVARVRLSGEPFSSLFSYLFICLFPTCILSVDWE